MVKLKINHFTFYLLITVGSFTLCFLEWLIFDSKHTNFNFMWTGYLAVNIPAYFIILILNQFQEYELKDENITSGKILKEKINYRDISKINIRNFYIEKFIIIKHGENKRFWLPYNLIAFDFLLSKTKIKLQIQAVTIIIEKDGRYLLGKRSTWKTTAPGYWCPVSGKIETNESEVEAVCREAYEEVGLKVKPIKKLCVMDTKDGSSQLHWWLAEILEGEAYLKNDEHSEIGWFTIDEIGRLEPTFHEDLDLFRSLTQSK